MLHKPTKFYLEFLYLMCVHVFYYILSRPGIGCVELQCRVMSSVHFCMCFNRVNVNK